MNINGINNFNSINYYKKVSSNKVNSYDKEKVKNNMDRIEISKESKNLLENKINSEAYNEKKVNSIKNQVLNGTYTYDSKLIAKSIFNSMKGLE